METRDIKYINKDFSDFKAALIEYAKAYFPTSYTDFSTASPGSMFIEMAAYVGDVLSFYLDNQVQETFLQYAKQKENLFTLAYMLGYRPKVTSAAVVDLDIYQILPSSGSLGSYVPDYRYALLIEEGLEVASTVNTDNIFRSTEKVDFSVSSSQDPTEVSIYSVDNNGDPIYYLLKKRVKALSGTLKTTTVTFGTPTNTPYQEITITDTDIIGIVDIVDSDNNRWYEVPFLAQDTILKPVSNLSTNNPVFSNDRSKVPYLLEVEKVAKRFVTRFKSDDTLTLTFGASDYGTFNNDSYTSNIGDNNLPNPLSTTIGTIDKVSRLSMAFDPSYFTKSPTYGIVPSNTILTIRYLTGGGSKANEPSNQLNKVVSINTSFYGGILNNAVSTVVEQSVTINNPDPATGGGDGDTPEQIRDNTLLQYGTQMRAVTNTDYLAICYSMSPKFGEIAKAYVTKDDILITNGSDSYTTALYILTYNASRQLALATDALKYNLKTYLSNYRIMTDTISIKDAYIVNIGVNFEITVKPTYSSIDVLSRCLIAVKSYFDIDNWEINKPILLSEVYSLLDDITGVQTVQKVIIENKSGEAEGYSKYAYDISAATLKNVVYPSLDPCIFEVKYPDVDIKGKVVTF